MKKIAVFILAAAIIFSLPGCGKQQDISEKNQESAESVYDKPIDVLTKIVDVYRKDDLFAMYGGNQENAVMDAPGEFDVGKTEELENTLGLPQDQVSNITDAASMVHMMNGNIFTGAAYCLKDDVDVEAFADSVKSCILGKQWLCGQPDTLLIIQVDGSYVVTAYGEAGIIEVFKTNALSVLDGAQIITETPIA